MFFEKRPQYLEGALESRFAFDHSVGETADAIGYYAYDKEAKKHRVVWTTRKALSEVQKKSFFKHVRALITTRVEPVLEFGADSVGVGFVVLSASITKSLDFDHGDAAQKTRRFIKALLAVEKIHAAGHHCGNLTPGSFMLDVNEQVRFVGFIGGLRRHTAAPVAPNFQRYVSPEALSGELTSPSCDVYALGVIGLELFGVGFPEGALVLERVGGYLTTLQKDAPVWLQAVLPTAVTSSRDHRLQNAGQLLSAVALQLKNHEELVKDDGGSDEVKARAHDDFVYVNSLPRSSRRLRRRILAFLQIPAVSIALALGVLALGSLYGFHNGMFEQAPEQPETPLKVVVPQSKDLRTRLAMIRELDTPDVFAMLKAEENATSVAGERILIWGSIVEYGRHSGLPHTAGVVQRLLDMPSPRVQSLMADIVQVFNPAWSHSMDSAIVSALEGINPDDGYVLAAALTLDLSDSSRFRDVLLKGACSAFQRTPANRCEDISTLGLILAISSTRSLYFSDVLNSQTTMSESDFWPLLGLMVAQRAEEQKRFARFGIEQKIVAWPRAIFLDIISSVGVSVWVPASALTAAARGVFTDKAVAQFSDWYEPASVRALLGTLLVASEDAIRRLALDALNNKPISDKVLRAILEFIQGQGADVRLSYATLVGIVGLREQAPEGAFIAGLRDLNGVPNRNAICVVLLRNGDAKVIRAVLDLYGSSLNPDLLLSLLGHEDREIRLAVLPYVKGVFLTTAKQTLQNYYLHEQDPTVRAGYEQQVPELLR